MDGKLGNQIARSAAIVVKLMDFEARGKPTVKNIVGLIVKNIYQGNF